MLSLQEQLNQISWKSLKHAYGPATDTPMHLLALLSEEEEERDKALARLWASICHQGSVYEASAVAASFLIQILEQVPDEQKPPLLDLLDGLAVRHWYVGRDLMKLTMIDTKHQRWRSSEQFLREGNHYHKPEWMESSHASVGEGIPVFLSLLQSKNQETVYKTLVLLSAFQELNQAIVPTLRVFISEVDDATLKALALECLGDLLAEQAKEERQTGSCSIQYAWQKQYLIWRFSGDGSKIVIGTTAARRIALLYSKLLRYQKERCLTPLKLRIFQIYLKVSLLSVFIMGSQAHTLSNPTTCWSMSGDMIELRHKIFHSDIGSKALKLYQGIR